MRKHFIALGLLLILACAVFCYANNGKGQTKASAAKTKTGDIEVTARKCDNPIYINDGHLKLRLNKMPERAPVHIPKWIRPMPKAGEGIGKWFKELEDSLGDSLTSILEYIYDSLGLGDYQSKPVEFFDQLNMAEGVTDSLGYYVFRDVPVGLYQIVCAENPPQPQGISNVDSLRKFIADHGPIYAPIPERTGFGRSGTCQPGATDDVRVASDSVSVVRMKMFRTSWEEVTYNEAMPWTPKFKKREK